MDGAAASSSHRSPAASVVAVVAVVRRCPATRGAVEQGDALLDALERLDDVALEPDQDTDRVLVGAAADLLGVAMGVGDDLAALGLGRLGQATLVDQERGLLLGLRDDPLGLLLGLLDDPLALGVDALRSADLLGDGDAKLVDETERRVLVDDDVVRQREFLAVRDQRLEALDEEDDVDAECLPARSAAARWGLGDYGTRRV